MCNWKFPHGKCTHLSQMIHGALIDPQTGITPDPRHSVVSKSTHNTHNID